MSQGPSQNPLDYNVRKLRAVSKSGESEEVNDPTHECQTCGWRAEVDDYQKHTPNWCEACEKVKTFVRLNSK